MTIGGLQKLTLIDYPGKLACTVFLAGCNFRCPWCYSSELVLPEKIKKQPLISEKYFFDFLKEKKGLLEGVVLCGGEPSFDPGLPAFAKKIKKLGYSVKLDTNGSNPEILKGLFKKKLVDYVAMDVKVPLEIKSQIPNPNAQSNPKSQILKHKNEIKKSIEIIKNSGIDYEFRTTVVPTILEKKDILEIARDISGAKRYYLQNFRPEKTLDPKFEKIKPYPEKYLLDIVKTVSPFFETCQLR